MVKDNNGRVVWSLVEINTKMLLIIRVYAPAQGDDSNFFKDDVFPILGKVDYDHVVIGGDWNLGIAEDLDYWDYSCTDPVRPKSGRQIHKYIEHYELLKITYITSNWHWTNLAWLEEEQEEGWQGGETGLLHCRYRPCFFFFLGMRSPALEVSSRGLSTQVDFMQGAFRGFYQEDFITIQHCVWLCPNVLLLLVIVNC